VIVQIGIAIGIGIGIGIEIFREKFDCDPDPDCDFERAEDAALQKLDSSAKIFRPQEILARPSHHYPYLGKISRKVAKTQKR
jgi:hypothetical protein